MSDPLSATLLELAALGEERRRLETRHEVLLQEVIARMAPVAAEACAGWDPVRGERAVMLDLSGDRPRAWTLTFREKGGGALRFAESAQSNAFYTLRLAEGFEDQEMPSYILPIHAYRLLQQKYGWPQPD